MPVNKKKQTAKLLEINTRLWVVACGLVVVLLVVGGLSSKHNGNQLTVRAKAANSIGLDQLTIPKAVEMARQSKLECVSTNFYGGKLCTALESRAYAIPGNVATFEAAMADTLSIHGWASDTRANLPDGYFFQPPRSGNKVPPLLTSASVTRLAFADNGTDPVQSHVNLSLVGKVPPSNGQPVDNTAFSYSDTSLKQKFDGVLANGQQLLFITSDTSYRTGL